MPRTLSAAAVVLPVAVLAAIAAAVLPASLQRESLGLFAFAVAGSVGVAILLVADSRRRRAVRRGVVARMESPLHRLDHLPTVTTGTRRIRWRGGPYRLGRQLAEPAAAEVDDVALVGSAQPGRDRMGQLTGSGYPRRASSTRQPQSDGAEADPRAS
jgi:hypothetical protein